MSFSKKFSAQKVRHVRLRKRISGTADRPRLSVHFSGQHIYAQVIDDVAGRTIVGVSTTEKTIASGGSVAANIETAARVGREVATRATAAQVTRVVFDRGGSRFHGKVKALADAAREGGLNF
jgi:large subunit ribosomal protein L18